MLTKECIVSYKYSISETTMVDSILRYKKAYNIE